MVPEQPSLDDRSLAYECLARAP